MPDPDVTICGALACTVSDPSPQLAVSAPPTKAARAPIAVTTTLRTFNSDLARDVSFQRVSVGIDPSVALENNYTGNG
jgi:hypothetical protein